MDALYRDYILEHYKNPRNYGTLEPHDLEFHDHNPLCGDELGVHIRVEDGKVADLRFHGQGCAISQAAASITSEELIGMDVQEAVEAANITSYQMRNSFGDHETLPGRLTLRSDTPPWQRRELRDMGYRLDFQDRTSGPINAIFFDWKHGSFWGGSSNHGEDYGIAW